MNPYGIQQVDVPGLLSVYQNAKQARSQQMLARKQQEAADKQADRDQRFSEILAKGMGGAANAFGGQPQPTGGAVGATEAFGQPPAPAAPQRTNFQINPETMSQLIAIDANEATKVFQAFSQMNNAQHEASKQVNDTLGRAAQHLLSIPEPERQAEIQRIAPMLMQQGIDEAMITQFAPTERNLQFLVAQSRDIEKLREEFMPKLRNVQAGDMIIDERRIGEPGSPTVYESPYIKGPDGAIYERPQTAPQQQTATNPQTGETVVWDGQQWKPLGPPPVSAAPPRASAADVDAALASARTEGDDWLKRQGFGGGDGGVTSNFR